MDDQKTVLVVDDDEVICNVFNHTLSREGYRSLCAGSGEQAVEMVSKHKVHMVIMDMNMPGMNGIETVQAIRKTHDDMPFIFISDEDSDEILLNASRVGALAYLTKPVDNRQLSAVVKSSLYTAGRLHRIWALSQDRQRIAIAVGIIMGRIHCDEDLAEVRLREIARSRSIRMVDLAESVIQGETLTSPS